MKEIILMRGLPGSGKSTKAKELVSAGKGRVVRVNKDELRAMLFPGLTWHPKHESLVVNVQKQIVDETNYNGVDVVIIDDTNYNPKIVAMWENLAKMHTWKFSIHDMGTDVETCIRNDIKRKDDGGRYVGADVIRNMAMKHNVIKQEKEFVIFDLDGTLCDITVRRKAAEMPDGKLNYGKFFDPTLVATDTPRQEIIDKIKGHCDQGHEIIIMSGRSDRTREATTTWLSKYGVAWDRLIMRPDTNYQDDAVLKQGFLTNYVEKSKCIMVYDDRPKVIRMWKKEGLTVVDVGNGIEF